MELTKEQWLQVLNQFYNDCFDFWMREGLDETQSKAKAKNDIKNVGYYPYVPKGPAIPDEIKSEFLNSLD